MRFRIGRGLVAAALLGFLVVGGLLAAGHAGFAIKITNYIFFLLLGGIIYEKLS